MSAQKPREIAAHILLRRVKSPLFVEEIFEQEAARALSGKDLRLCQELVYGAVRWQSTLDWLIGRKTGGRTQKPALQVLLRLGLYQLFWLDRIPHHAAVHESVALAKQLGLGAQAGFVNAVLRGYIRERSDTELLLSELPAHDPALAFSHPAWLVDRWEERWGKSSVESLLKRNNSPPTTFARRNRLKADRATLEQAWKNESVVFRVRQFDWVEEGMVYELEAHPSLATLESFKRGFFYIQDPSTLLAVQELRPLAGETILDACAAPGGKTGFLADLIGNQGRIVAEDADPSRLKLVRENCLRLGATCVEVAEVAKVERQERYDRVLIDVPCSNTGVLRRRLDLRWRISLDEIKRLSAVQLKLLQQNAHRLKAKGRLVYSTCSLEVEENEGVVGRFLETTPGFEVERQRQLLPMTDEVDGAFVAVLRKK